MNVVVPFRTRSNDVTTGSLLFQENLIPPLNAKGRTGLGVGATGFVLIPYFSIREMFRQVYNEMGLKRRTYTSSEMYKLALGALFKNEAHCLQEWITHYEARGVDKIYLINDESTDDYMTVLAPFLERGLVTLIDAHWDHYHGRQRDMYTHYLLPRFAEAEWFIICDLDEFIWSPVDTNFPRLLNEKFQHIAVIQIHHTVFGSNGHIVQPPSLVAGFTRRTAECPSLTQNEKCIYNTKHKFLYLNVHYPTFADPEDKERRFVQFPDWWRLNHYSCQSRDFWNFVKCTRGDADQFRTRMPHVFYELDRNEVEDLGLYEQNRQLGILPSGS